MGKKKGATKPGVTREAPTIVVPQDRDAAVKALARMGELQRNAQTIANEADKNISRLQEGAAAKLTPIREELMSLFAGLKAFADARRGELTKNGATKTIELETGLMAWKDNPPSVEIITDEKQVIDAITSMGLKDQFLTKPEPGLNRQAMLKAPELASTVPGIKIGQKEAFRVKPTEGTGELTESNVEQLLKA